jgi:(p)ppGpp synthase/HD superfamily hydrolase
MRRAALECARQLHTGQSREVDGAPIIFHPREVASLLHRADAPDHVVSAVSSPNADPLRFELG